MELDNHLISNNNLSIKVCGNLLLPGVRQAMPGHWKSLPGKAISAGALNLFRHVGKGIKISV
jgi:hypothetical protein